jgi:hypothetical protein
MSKKNNTCHPTAHVHPLCLLSDLAGVAFMEAVWWVMVGIKEYE